MFKIISTFFFLITVNLVAQTYSIPGANEQPEWVFPLWFEDGTGARDTLYFGYDSEAEDFGYPQADTIFGEVLAAFDTSKFGVYWEQGFTIEETIQVLIWKNLYQSSIFFNKAKLPVTITWDNNLFYSENLPFPDNSTLPNGWGLVHCASVGFEGCQETIEGAIVITDTPDEDVWSAFETDSLWFNSDEYTYFSNYLNFEVLQYGYAHGWMILENEHIKNYKIGPNPASEYIRLYLNSPIRGNISITNLYGTIYKQYFSISSDLINIKDLPPGIYFLNFYSHNIQLTKKFIKL